jgi:hypothetical protein
MTPHEVQIAIVLARRSAMRAIQKQRKRAGLRQSISHAVLAAMANQWLDAHPNLYAEAAADPLVRELARGRR